MNGNGLVWLPHLCNYQLRGGNPLAPLFGSGEVEVMKEPAKTSFGRRPVLGGRNQKGFLGVCLV